MTATGGTRPLAGSRTAAARLAPAFLASLLACCGAALAGERYELTLAGALPGGKDLTLHLDRRGGRVRRAFASARAFNQAPHDVDASALEVTADRLAGHVKVTLNADNWIPKDRKPVACKFSLAAAVRGGTVAGTFAGTCGPAEVKGKVSGRRRARREPATARRFELVLERPLSGISRHWQNRAYVGFTLQGGRAVAAKIASPNNTTYADWTCRPDALDLTLRDGRLTGTIRATVSTRSRWCRPGEHRLTLAGDVIGGTVAGSFTTRRGGEEAAAGRFLGAVAPAPAADAREGTYELHLHEAVPAGRAMWVHLDCGGGAFRPGLAFSPTFNHAVHDADASGLKLAGGRLTGTLKVTVNADPYVPKDGQPIACVYTVDAGVADGGLAGTFTGTFGGEALRGTLGGLYGPVAVLPRRARIWLKMEQGVTGSNPWHNRTYLGVKLEAGRATGGSFSNNKGAWKGTFDGAELRLASGRLTGTIKGTVTSGHVRTGTYTFTLDGRRVGSFLTGRFRSTLGGRVVRSGRFIGGVQPAE